MPAATGGKKINRFQPHVATKKSLEAWEIPTIKHKHSWTYIFPDKQLSNFFLNSSND